MIRWIWLCSQLSRSKSPEPGLLTSSWFLFCMLLFACWSMPWDGAQLNEEKWKHGAMPDSFAAVLLIMKHECDSGQTDKNGNVLSLVCSTSGSLELWSFLRTCEKSSRTYVGRNLSLGLFINLKCRMVWNSSALFWAISLHRMQI